jgi:elongation factor Ts
MTPAFKVIEGYVHNGRVGVLVEIGLGTSFTAGMAEFKQLAKDIALQVAAAPVSDIEALMAQSFVKDPSLSIVQLLANASRQLGEGIVVTRFVRWEADEGILHPPDSSPAVAAVGGRRAS